MKWLTLKSVLHKVILYLLVLVRFSYISSQELVVFPIKTYASTFTRPYIDTMSLKLISFLFYSYMHTFKFCYCLSKKRPTLLIRKSYRSWSTIVRQLTHLRIIKTNSKLKSYKGQIYSYLKKMTNVTCVVYTCTKWLLMICSYLVLIPIQTVPYDTYLWSTQRLPYYFDSWKCLQHISA